MRSQVLAVAGALALATAFACGADDPEAELAKASAAVVEARAEVEQAQQRVDAIAVKVRAIQEDFEEAERLHAVSLRKLAETEARVSERATDDIVFRSVQRRLLEDPELEDAAIRAQVTGGLVVLSGAVEGVELRDRAVEVATATPGVRQVESRIRVPAGEAPPEATVDPS